jgi:elongation factor P
MIAASGLRPGMAIRLESEPYKVVTAEYHAGGGKMGGVTHTRLLNLRTGTFRDWRFRSDETVEQIDLERQAMQFLFGDSNTSCFMNPQSFEQVEVENALLGHGRTYLTEGMTLWIEFLDDQPVGAVFPEHIEVRVEETAPPAHAGGADNVWKKARLENGATVMVPPFIAPGERIRLAVESGAYVGRVKEEKK